MASLFHLLTIFWGAEGYRLLGAGEEMVRLAEAGSWRPVMVAISIAGALALWGLYAFSGAGLVRGLPLRRPLLVFVTAFFLLRALAILPAISRMPERLSQAHLWSAGISLVLGLLFLLGLVQTWRRL